MKIIPSQLVLKIKISNQWVEFTIRKRKLKSRQFNPNNPKLKLEEQVALMMKQRTLLK